ncbi:unnamed protein product [Symbiodinium sp. CCMP2592]|nr:unnamed protein product [Symbiodinium sp. CCMP2592]
MAVEGQTGEQLLMRLLQTQQEQMGQLQRLLEQNQRPRGTVVDTKAIGRPEKLGGTLEEASRAWRQWNYRLELWLTSQFPETRAILTWARTQDEEITVTRLREQLVEGVTPEKVQEFNRQLEVVLGTLTVDTPGDITMNSSAGSGLDMYRRLHGRLDPTDMVTSFRWLRQLMSTKPVAEVSDLIAAVERWEDQHRRHAARRDCTALTERKKMVSLLGLVPAELQSHLELNLPRLNSYDLLRREIVTFAENRRAFTCGKVGHLLKDCRSPIDIRKNKDAGGGSSGPGGNPKNPTPGGRGSAGNPPKGKAQGRGRGGKGNRGGHARELEGEEEEPDNEEPEQEEDYEAEGDDDWDSWHPDSGAGSNLVSELQARQAELNRALASAEGDEERANLEAQLEEVTRQLKELVAKRRAARTTSAGSWKTSARFLADVRAGRKAKLAKRKELSRQRAAKHRQGLAKGYNKPLRGDDGKRAAFPLMPENTEREARPLNKRARENLRQEGAGDDVPEERSRSWREKPKTPGERAGKRRREAARKRRKEEAASGSAGPASGTARVKAAAKPEASQRPSVWQKGHRPACRAGGGACAEASQA